MRRLLPFLLAGIWAASCHINEVAEDILELKLADSLKTCARLDIAIENAAGTALLERVWSAPPPDPVVIRHVFDRAPTGDFRVRVACVDGAEQVRTIKTIPYRGGSQGTVHVVHGSQPRYRIAAFRLIDSADGDGDGHFRAYRLVLDVDGNTDSDTLRMSLSYQVQGNSRWFPLIPSRMLPVTGAVTDDTVSQGLEGGAKRVISLKAEIRTAAGDSLDQALIAGIREETPAQDSAGLRWVFRNHSGAVLTLDAEVGPEVLTDLTVGTDDSVVVRLDRKTPLQEITYAAVAQGPGEGVAWESGSPMEMDRFDAAAEAGPSDSHFALNLLNRSGKSVTGIILDPGTPAEKTFAVDLPSRSETRNLGLFPYGTGATVAFRLEGGGIRAFNTEAFRTHARFGYRFAEYILEP